MSQKLKHLQGRVIPELYGIADIQSGAGVLVTSFFHGTPLSQVSCTAPIGKQVLSSVSQVHAGGVVHGDLHPGNLLLVVGRPSAPAAAGAAGSGGSNSSQAVPDYSSTPEQQTGASDAAAASAQQTESTHVVVLDFGHAWWAGEDSAASAAEELKRLRRSLKAR
jgi:serine/threonine protein kinase